MERLARAQARKAGGADEGAVEEIKRLELENAWGDRRAGFERRAANSNDRRLRGVNGLTAGAFPVNSVDSTRAGSRPGG